jgi:hypothetical protein
MASDFLQFAESGTANVYTQAEYIADADKSNGNQPGIAKAKLVNKALRQCSTIASVVSNFIADITGTTATDDGTTATLLTNLKSATNVAYQTNAATAKTTLVDADLLPIADSAASFGLKKLSWANFKAFLDTRYALVTATTPALLVEYTEATATNQTIDITGLDINTHRSYRIEITTANNTAVPSSIYVYFNNILTAGSYTTKYFDVTTSLNAPATSNAALVMDFNSTANEIFATYNVKRSPGGQIGLHGEGWETNGAMGRYTFMRLDTTQTNCTRITLKIPAASSYFALGTTVRIYRGDR